MNRGNGWRVGLMLVALWLSPRAALAETLCVESLCMPHAAPWQRGPAQQEQADEVYILDQPADRPEAAQVVLLRRAPVIKGDAQSYYDKLTRFWHATYGKAVLIDWLEVGGRKWRSLRRPSSENGMGVFQLSTVFDGRAYSLLVFVPGTVTVLPAPVMDLLAGIRFASQADAAPAAAPVPVPMERWVRSRTYRFDLSGEVLEAVVAPDAERMGQDGMLTGYGLDYGETRVDWFMEGYEWKTVAGRVARVPWATRGRLEVDAPAELGDGAWTLRLTLPEAETAVSARLVVWDLCAPENLLKEVLERLDRGVRGPMERLAADKAATCAIPEPVHLVQRLQGEPGKTATAVWTLPGPRWEVTGREVAGREREGKPSRVRLVEAVLEPGAERTVPGDGLLERARLFFAYEPR